MTLYYVIVFTVLGLFSLSVILGWLWAVRDGQFRNVKDGAYSIFDADEPPGEVTDVYPDRRNALRRHQNETER